MKDSIEIKCLCGTLVAVEYNTVVSGEHGEGNYYEGKCPECSKILTLGVYDAQ